MFSKLKSLFVDLLLALSFRCHEMSRLASQGLDRKLPLLIRLRIRLHMLICVWCQRYARQLRFLREAAPHLHDHSGPNAGSCLSPEARERMKRELRASSE